MYRKFGYYAFFKIVMDYSSINLRKTALCRGCNVSLQKQIAEMDCDVSRAVYVGTHSYVDCIFVNRLFLVNI